MCAKAKPDPAARIRTYLGAITPAGRDLARGYTSISKANSELKHGVAARDADEISQAARDLRRAQRLLSSVRRRIGKVPPPLDLADAQDGLLDALASDAGTVGTLAGQIESGIPRNFDLEPWLSDYSSSLAAATRFERDWRDALKAKLRQFQLPVPPWLKNVGKILDYP